MKLYTSKSNAKRAAKKQFGENATEGNDFQIVPDNMYGKIQFGFIPVEPKEPENTEPTLVQSTEAEVTRLLTSTIEDKPVEDKPALKGRPKSTTGVLAVMQATLEKATADNPTSKESILSVLKKKFPERDARKMMVSINTMIPTDFRNQRGLNIQTVKTDGQRTYFVAA